MTLPHDRQVAAWLADDSHEAPPGALARALAATHRTRKRPRWSFPERWIPMQLAMTRTQAQRPALAIVVLVLLVAVLFATALYIGSQRRQYPPPFGPARNGAIVYAMDGDLFIADQPQGAPRPLVAGPQTDSNPVFSDQGDRIAFAREALGETRILTIRPDGLAITKLATGLLDDDGSPGTVTDLRWSPDGSALLARIHDGDGEVTTGSWYLIDGDGSGFRRLDQDSGFHFGMYAAWRPNGRHIATWGEVVGTQDQDGPPGLYIVDAHGANVGRMADVANPVGIEWSPDGRQLAFVSPDGIDGPFRITIADIDESGALTALHLLRLDPESSSEWRPKWSPDGRQLAFVTEKDVRSHIGVVNADGTGYRIVGPELSDLAATNPIWSPDGRSLVVTEDQRGPRTASEGAWLIDAATGAQTEVGMPVDSWQRLAP